MNLKTTLALVVLAPVGCALYFLDLSLPALMGGKAAVPVPDAGTLDFLKQDLTADKLTRIEIQQGEQRLVLLERPPGGDWALPGGWPTRPAEVAALVKLLTELHSRFAPIPLGEEHKPE